MSLQEIERSHIHGGQEGLDRKIDESSEKMMLDILQVSQYAKPIESTVRELASNAVDSQKEKEIAIEILTGKSEASKYYHTREGAQYDASKWTPDYYDLNHLNTQTNKVHLEYIEGEGQGFCDQFVVTDHGVGLGMPRLAGYFKLGFSTKRNSANAFGAFGLGAKASLSTGTDHYVMETVHNGKKFRFNCFSYKVDSLIPKFNPNTKKENGKVNIGTEEKPYFAHYELTDEKNYTKVITPVKRHNRNRYKQAVKNQLLYFENVIFKYTYEDNTTDTINFKARVLHNSENLLVSDTYQFSRPHIVVVKEKGSSFGVSYGTIDFQELEIEPMRGTVGFKCPIRAVDRDPETGEETVIQDGVTVTPSRESVIWDRHTREYIQKIVKNAEKEASKLVSDELKEDDFVIWLSKANKVINNSTSSFGQTTALSQLAKLIDRKKITAAYPKDKSIRFYQNPQTFFKGFSLRVVKVESGKWNSELGKHETKVVRPDIAHWGEFNPDRVYMLGDDDRPSPVKDRFLRQLHSSNFLVMRLDSDESIEKAFQAKNKDATPVQVGVEVNKIVKRRDKIWELLKKNDHFPINHYSEVEVPESFEKRIQEEEENKAAASLSPAEKRELQGKVVCYSYARKDASYGRTEYRLDKKEPVLGKLDDVVGKVIYGTQKDDPLLKMLAEIYHNTQQKWDYQPDYFPLNRVFEEKWTGVNLLRFSKRNLKHVKKNPNFIEVKKYLWNHKDNEYNVGTDFVPFFTAEHIQKRLENMKFLRNFKDFNEDLSTAFNYLEKYVSSNYSVYLRSALDNNNEFQSFKLNAKKGTEMQDFLRTDPSKEGIKAKSKELFDHDKIKSAKVYDDKIMDLVEELETFSENIGELFNSIEFLKDISSIIPDNAQRLIQDVLTSESLAQFKLTENSTKILDK